MRKVLKLVKLKWKIRLLYLKYVITISCLQAQRYLKILWWQNFSRGTVTVSSELLLTSHIVLYSGELFFLLIVVSQRLFLVIHRKI